MASSQACPLCQGIYGQVRSALQLLLVDFAWVSLSPPRGSDHICNQVLAFLVLAMYACVHVHPCQSVNTNLSRSEGFPGGTSGKDPTCLCRRCKRCGFNPWVGKSPWRRALQLTPVFLPRESHGQRSLGGCSPWGCKELDTTEAI